jgi:polyisoprenoid-binding protein YceI
MRRSALLSLVLTLALAAFATTVAAATSYDIDATHSTVGFKVKHMMVSNVRGQFGDFAGTFTWDAANPAASTVNATIQVASVDTDNDKRDDHLRTTDFFDAATHPTMTFVSTRFEPKGKDLYAMHGDLTLRGVTRPVVLDLEFLGEMSDPKAGTRVGWEARGVINRRDFGVDWSKTLDSGGVVVGDEVTIELAVEGVRKD